MGKSASLYFCLLRQEELSKSIKEDCYVWLWGAIAESRGRRQLDNSLDFGFMCVVERNSGCFGFYFVIGCGMFLLFGVWEWKCKKLLGGRGAYPAKKFFGQKEQVFVLCQDLEFLHRVCLF